MTDNPKYAHPPGSSCPVVYNRDNSRKEDDEHVEREGVKRRGPDWAEKNPEAADLEAQANRMNILENGIASGRTYL